MMPKKKPVYLSEDWVEVLTRVQATLQQAEEEASQAEHAAQVEEPENQGKRNQWQARLDEVDRLSVQIQEQVSRAELAVKEVDDLLAAGSADLEKWLADVQALTGRVANAGSISL